MQGLEVNVTTNADQVAMDFLASGADMQGPAMVRALNKMADQVKVAAAREVRDAGYKLKISIIKKAISVRRASAGNLRASVVAKGRPIPLANYGARGPVGKGVSVNVLKGRKVIAGAFIATMPSGHKGVFVREKNAKHKKMRTGGKVSWHALPIKELFGPSVPDGLANKAVQSALMTMVQGKFPVLLQHEHAWLRRRLASKAAE